MPSLDPIEPPLPAALDGSATTLGSSWLRLARWATRAQFAALGLFSGFWGVHIPSIKATYTLGEAALSLVLLAVALGSVAALPLAGRAIAVLGTQQTARLTALWAGMSIALALHWPSWLVLIASMLLMGAALSLFDIAINTEGSALETASRRPIMGNLHGCFSAGGMVGAMVASGLIGAGMAPAWQLGLAGAGVALLVLFSARGMLPAHLTTKEPDSTASHAFRWPRGTLLVLGLLALAGMSTEGTLYDWCVLYLKQEIGMPQAQAAWGYAIFSGAMAAARFGGDALRARFAESRLLRACGILSVTAITMVLTSADPTVALVGLGLVGMGLSMVVPILYNAASRVPGQSRANAIATVSAMGYSGFLIAPPIIGGLAELSSLTWALGLLVPVAGMLAWGADRIPPIASPAAPRHQ